MNVDQAVAHLAAALGRVEDAIADVCDEDLDQLSGWLDDAEFAIQAERKKRRG